MRKGLGEGGRRLSPSKLTDYSRSILGQVISTISDDKLAVDRIQDAVVLKVGASETQSREVAEISHPSWPDMVSIYLWEIEEVIDSRY